MKFSVVILLFFFPFSLNAQDLFPHGCEIKGFGFDGITLTVNANGEQAYYLIHNRSQETIELERVKERDTFMSPPLIARISPQNWAAFASDIPDFHFQCFHIKGVTRILADCRALLDVCEYPRVQFALSNMGNYWVSIDHPQKEVITESAEKGIYLKW